MSHYRGEDCELHGVPTAAPLCTCRQGSSNNADVATACSTAKHCHNEIDDFGTGVSTVDYETTLSDDENVQEEQQAGATDYSSSDEDIEEVDGDLSDVDVSEYDIASGSDTVVVDENDADAYTKAMLTKKQSIEINQAKDLDAIQEDNDDVQPEAVEEPIIDNAAADVKDETPEEEPEKPAATPKGTKKVGSKLKWTPKASTPAYALAPAKRLDVDDMSKLSITTKGKAAAIAAAQSKLVAEKVKSQREKFNEECKSKKETNNMTRKEIVAKEKERAKSAKEIREKEKQRANLALIERKKAEQEEKERLQKEYEAKKIALKQARLEAFKASKAAAKAN